MIYYFRKYGHLWEVSCYIPFLGMLGRYLVLELDDTLFKNDTIIKGRVLCYAPGTCSWLRGGYLGFHIVSKTG